MPADTFRKIADRYEAKAAWARRRADMHAAGDAGESRLADALAPLEDDGWTLFHNRARPGGGNIDHLLIGPRGVFVLDSKAWTGPIRIEGEVLKANGRSQDRHLRSVTEQVSEVREALRRRGRRFDVNGALVFTGSDPGPDKPRNLRGVVVCGLHSLVPALETRPEVLAPAAVAAISADLAQAFPLMGVTPASAAETVLPGDAVPDPTAGFLRCSRWLYLEPWRKSGRSRLYLTDDAGEELGWKDLKGGSVTITYERNARLTRAVLMAANSTGLALPKDEVPKLPVQVAGGGFVSAVTRVYTTVHVGRRWRKGQLDRMYCTAADPVDGVYDLGWVDLVTGDLHPSSSTLPKHWAPAEHRLAWMLARRPTGS